MEIYRRSRSIVDLRTASEQFRITFADFQSTLKIHPCSMQCSGKKMFDFMFWMWIWLCCKRINTLMCVFAVAGVIYVCVHSATKVIASDYGGLSDPYCVVFSDRRRVGVISFFHQYNPTSMKLFSGCEIWFNTTFILKFKVYYTG